MGFSLGDIANKVTAFLSESGKVTSAGRIDKISEIDKKTSVNSDNEQRFSKENILKLEEKIFNEQCFLVENLATKFKNIADQQQYKNFTIAEGDPAQIDHYLTARRGLQTLMEIRTEQVALLVPRIKIFKVSYPYGKNNAPIEQEVRFNDHLSQRTIENIIENKTSRGDEVGIKSFSYELSGQNIALTGYTTCILKLFFRNVASFVNDTTQEGVSFKELILRGFSKSEETLKDTKIASSFRDPDSEHFRIKIETGWADPIDPEGILISQELKRAIRRSRTYLFLQLEKHEINFNQDGSLELNLYYRGSAEGSLKDVRSDIFMLDKENSKNMISESKPQEKEELIDFRSEEEILQQVVEDDIIKYSKLLTRLLENSNIYYIDIPFEFIRANPELAAQGFRKTARQDIERAKALNKAEIVQITEQGRRNLKQKTNLAVRNAAEPVVDEKNNLNIKYTDKRKENIQNIITNNFTGTNIKKLKKDYQRVYFFFFGSLLDAALEALKDRKDTYNLKFLVGTLLYTDPRDPFNKKGAIPVNLADIPISLNLFMQWYMTNVIAKRVSKYLVQNFIRDTIETLIVAALGESCFFSAIPEVSPHHEIKLTNYTIFARDFFESKKNRIDASYFINKHQNDIFDQETHYNISKLDDVLFFYVTTENLILQNLPENPTEEDNIKNGIYHLYPAADRGIVKKIEFSKYDIPYWDEYRVEVGSQDLSRIRYVYNATVTMVGNSFFRPGSYVYIDTEKFGLGPAFIRNNVKTHKGMSVAQLLGLGGYYKIIKMEANLDSNNYETIIECKWIHNGGVRRQKISPGEFSKRLQQKRNSIKQGNKNNLSQLSSLIKKIK